MRGGVPSIMVPHLIFSFHLYRLVHRLVNSKPTWFGVFLLRLCSFDYLNLYMYVSPSPQAKQYRRYGLVSDASSEGRDLGSFFSLSRSLQFRRSSQLRGGRTLRERQGRLQGQSQRLDPQIRQQMMWRSAVSIFHLQRRRKRRGRGNSMTPVEKVEGALAERSEEEEVVGEEEKVVVE